MALVIGDRIADGLDRAGWRATDSITGANIAVNISFEALADKGEAECLSKAQEKYDGSGNPVHVTTGDFSN